MRGRLVAAAGTALALRDLARRRRTIELRGRVALVTGGSRGLGFAIARELSSQGARVAIVGRDEETLERARGLLAARGAEVLALRCDVADREAVARTVSEVTEQLGPIDVLVNNAGVIAVGTLDTQRLEDFEEMHRIMFWGVVNTTFAVLPGMRARRGGRIANVTSIGGKVSVPGLLSYNAAKFAAVGFSEGARAELARDGILVTTIVPGLMRTGSYTAALFKGRRELLYTLFAPLSATPLSTVAADRAARRIVAALRRGDPELILSLHANLAVRANGLAPGTTARVLGLVGRLLPAGGDPTPVPGREIRSWVDRTPLTALGRRAAKDLNQRLD